MEIHPEDPQPRLIRQAADMVRAGGVIIYPTDSCYALGCQIGDKKALGRICAIRRLHVEHNFTLVCRDLSEIGLYARLDNAAYRLMKVLTPGPYTFLLQASREVPRRLQNARRKTIGLRVPDHAIAQALLAELGAPLMSTSLILPGDTLPLTDPQDMRDLLGARVDLIIDGGPGGIEATTVIDMARGPAVVVRRGKGDAAYFIEDATH